MSAGRGKANLGNRTPRSPAQIAILDANRHLSCEARARTAQASRDYAARYRAEQPFKVLLDSFYGEAPAIAHNGVPFPGHRRCDQWGA